MNEKKKRLGDFLVDEGLIDRYQLQAALAEQKKWGGRLGKHLIELGILSEEILVKVLSKLVALPSVDVGRLSIARATLDYVPVKTAEKFNLIPIAVEEAAGGKKTVIVAMADPTNLAALDELRFTSGCAVRPVVSGDTSIERAIKSYYHGIQNPGPTPGVRRGSASGEGELVIMDKGEPRTMKMSDDPAPGLAGGVVPQGSQADMSSLPPHALSLADGGEDHARRLNALLRVLVRRKLMTEEEFLAELAKG